MSTEGDTAAPTGVDRSCDLSQPLEKLHPDERMKAESNYLRGTIADSLLDPLTGAVTQTDAKLMKFHGIYQQDDRDLREERRRQKLEPDYQFMIRVRLAGGVCTPAQWLKLAGLALRHGNATLRLTTRQTFQFHGVLKGSLKPTLAGLHEALLDTIAACGDDTRGVMSSVNPHLSALHREVHELARRTSNEVIPVQRAYHEIWLDGEKVVSSEPEEPMYGPTYLPRKFKFGFAIPPLNDIDVYTQDVGFVAMAEGETLSGFDLTVGGGMGRTDRAPHTYPRLGDLIGYFPKDRLSEVALAIVTIQRDFGNRADRSRARFKYTLDDKGLPWFRRELEARLGFALEPARPFVFTTHADDYGWTRGSDGAWHYTLFVENGRIADTERLRLMTALQEIARVHQGEFRLTPNQNLIIANVPAQARAAIDRLLEGHGLHGPNRASALRLNSMACVGFPTCGLAMAESERYLPVLIDKVEAIAQRHGLAGQAIVTRMTGCPNGCARPYVAELAFTGRAPGKYNMYLGGGAHGQRLNRMYLENIGEERILAEIDRLFARYAAERVEGERFGDFVIRAGIVRSVESGVDFNRADPA
ncbi:MAG: assimilatory sulfite reductase (NADPH) hemoprotein subunit [Burkholderiales bacterium]|nr:assimilatory sulfite reductase (NADPH) hemoprotein subunit [Burkholderiales bacterium]OJX09139.1 MAG: sulfite reductase subunit beta [Burkholderiales bacterium 70-64]